VPGHADRVIEYARHVCGLAGANSTEFDAATPHPVVGLLEEQKQVAPRAARCGSGHACKLAAGSKARALFGADEISERHRHRYEFNNAYRDQLTKAGLAVSGCMRNSTWSNCGNPDPPVLHGCQFHPEFQSKPSRPTAVPRIYRGRAETEQTGAEITRPIADGPTRLRTQDFPCRRDGAATLVVLRRLRPRPFCLDCRHESRPPWPVTSEETTRRCLSSPAVRDRERTAGAADRAGAGGSLPRPQVAARFQEQFR